MAVLGFPCCVQAFSSCREWGPLSSCGAQASHCSGLSLWQSTGSRVLRLWQLGCTGSAAPWYMGSSWTRDWTSIPCVARQVLNHNHQGSPRTQSSCTAAQLACTCLPWSTQCLAPSLRSSAPASQNSLPRTCWPSQKFLCYISYISSAFGGIWNFSFPALLKAYRY